MTAVDALENKEHIKERKLECRFHRNPSYDSSVVALAKKHIKERK